MNITTCSWKKDIPLMIASTLVFLDLPSILVGLIFKLFFGTFGMVVGFIVGSLLTVSALFYTAAKDDIAINYKMDEDP